MWKWRYWRSVSGSGGTKPRTCPWVLSRLAGQLLIAHSGSGGVWVGEWGCPVRGSCRFRVVAGFGATRSGEAFDIIGDVMWLVEVEQWIESLSVREFATVAAAVERLAEDGSRLRFPASLSGGDAMVSC